MLKRAKAALFCLAAAAVALMSGCGGRPPAAATGIEFTAVLVMKYPKGAVLKRINFTRDRQRVESIGPGMGAAIVRLDKGVVWYLMPSAMRYLQLPLRPENKNPLMYIPDAVLKWEEVGRETIDGHPTIKERMVIRNKGGGDVAMYRWFATDIRWPIKAEDVKGGWTLAYKDIRLGPQAPSLFEVPAGFVRITNRMPG